LYRLAVGRDRNLGPAHNNLGVLLAARGDFAGAELEFREAVRLSPRDGILRRNLARALELGGNLSGALAEYEAALKAAPENLETQSMRDRVRSRLAAASSSRR
jgi:Flp pilus assembly protein TadD